MRVLLAIALFVMISMLPKASIHAQKNAVIDSLLKALDTEPSDKAKIDIWGALVVEYSFLDSAKTASYTSKIEALASKIDYREATVDAYYNFAWLLIGQGNYPEAKDTFDKALILSREIRYKSGEADANNGLGVINSDLGFYAKALEKYHISLKIFKSIGDSRGISKCYSNIGNVFTFSSNYDSAIFYQIQSTLIFEELNDKYRLSIAYRNVGTTYVKKGDYVLALDYYFKSLLLCEETGDETGIANSYTSIGVIYRKQKDYAEARKYFELSLELRNESQDKAGMAGSILLLGGVCEDQKEYENALRYYNESRRIFLEIGGLLGLSNSLYGIGHTNLMMKNFDKARTNLNGALKIARNINSKELESRFLLALGQVEFEKNNFLDAISLASRSMDLSNEIDHPNLLAEGAELAAKAYEAVSDYKNAYQSHVLFKSLKDSLLDVDKMKSIHLMEAKYENEKKQREIEQLTNDNKISRLEARQNGFYRNAALAGILAILIIGGLTINRYRLSQQRKQNLLEIVNLDIKQRLLRAQMNPHFIFNSLNSIQSYLAENKSDIAETYLIKFSGLMRGILESTTKDFIPLQEEIKILTLYLELEQLRFNHKFDFTIQHGSLNAGDIQLPPMISQPFIENAVLHGIKHFDGQGEILVNYTAQGELLQCSITDNGVGREQAQTMKSKTTTNHQSRAISLTKDRLTKMKNEFGLNIGFLISDLFESGVSKGTRVEINMPYQDF